MGTSCIAREEDRRALGTRGEKGVGEGGSRLYTWKRKGAAGGYRIKRYVLGGLS